MELQDNRLHAPINDALRDLARKVGLPLVATNCHCAHVACRRGLDDAHRGISKSSSAKE